MRTRLPTRLLALTAAGITLVGVGASGSQAADPFVAGERSTRSVVIGTADTGRALGRAAELSRALHLPGTSRTVTRLDDRFDHQVYDEVVARDGAGRQVAIARFRTDGRVVMAVALGWNRSAAPAVRRDAAASRAAVAARASGLKVQGASTVDAVSSGWSVRWSRVAAGAPVPGDGVRVLLWPDGSFHGLAVSERPLAAAPKHPVKVAQARLVAERTASGRYGAAARDLAIESAALAWVAPNDAWNAAASDAPAQTLRLAWVVTLRTDGQLAERVRGLQVWVDAGDGSVIGGDVLE